MASVYQKRGTWYIGATCPDGKRRGFATSATNERQARKLADELERRFQRERLGLEPKSIVSGGMTFGQLIDWWWDEYGHRYRSKTVKPFVEKHLRAPLGDKLLDDVSSSDIEGLLNAKADDLSPKSRNNLRGHIHRMFRLAIRRKKWSGTNPATEVPRERVPKRVHDYLRLNEVPLMLAAMADGRRPLFAAAVYTGMRQGELLGLLWTDVDFAERTITVARSYEGDTTKGGHSDVIPIADELMPYLEDAKKAARGSRFVFPAADGRMQPPDTALDKILRRALGRAGIVTGYRNVCRRRGCGYKHEQGEASREVCPKCHGMQLWPVPLPRHVRFHDLRHTTATLLLKAQVPLATVQRLMRHTDPTITAEIYGHLDLDDMRAGINRLSFGRAGQGTERQPEVARAAVGAATSDATQALPEPRREKVEGPDSVGNPSEIRPFQWSGRQDLNLRPLGPEPAPALPLESALFRNRPETRQIQSDGSFRGSECFPRLVTTDATQTLPGPEPNATRETPDEQLGDSRMMTPKEVAEEFRVSLATVYRWVSSGGLPHERAGNAIRIRRSALEDFTRPK